MFSLFCRYHYHSSDNLANTWRTMGMDNCTGSTLQHRFHNCLVFPMWHRNPPHAVQRMKRENDHTFLHLKQKLRMHGALLTSSVLHSLVLTQEVNLFSSTTILLPLLVYKIFSQVKRLCHTVEAEVSCYGLKCSAFSFFNGDACEHCRTTAHTNYFWASRAL
jgi:hypothetical protein